MSLHELHQKQVHLEQLLDLKLNILTFLGEMVSHVEFDIQELLKEQHRTEQQLACAVREL